MCERPRPPLPLRVVAGKRRTNICSGERPRPPLPLRVIAGKPRTKLLDLTEADHTLLRPQSKFLVVLHATPRVKRVTDILLCIENTQSTKSRRLPSFPFQLKQVLDGS